MTHGFKTAKTFVKLTAVGIIGAYLMLAIASCSLFIITNNPTSQPTTQPVITSQPTTSQAVGSQPAVKSAYYVSVGCAAAADTNPGTEALPFKTIQKAANIVQAGDTVYVKAGTYPEYVKITRSGTADRRITFRNYQNDVVVLDGGNTKAESMLIGNSDVNGQGSYVTIDGFEITNYVTNGIHMCGNVGGVLQNLNVHNNAATGIALHGSIVDAVVEYCHVHNNGVVGIYSVEAGGRNPGRPVNSAVRYSYVHHNGKANAENGDGITFYRTSGGEISYNVIHDNGDDGIDCVRNTHNINVHHNIVFRHMGQIVGLGGDGNGIKVDTSSDAAFGPSGNHVVHHNIVFCNSRGGTDYDVTLGQPGNSYYNNTLFYNAHAGIILDVSARSTRINVLRNNILKENGQRLGAPFGGTKCELHANQVVSVMNSDYNFIGDGKFTYANGVDREGGHSLSGDPMFVDPYRIDWITGAICNSQGELDLAWKGDVTCSTYNIKLQVERAFSLRLGSACIDAGELVAGVTSNYTGAAPDIGALEVQQ